MLGLWLVTVLLCSGTGGSSDTGREESRHIRGSRVRPESQLASLRTITPTPSPTPSGSQTPTTTSSASSRSQSSSSSTTITPTETASSVSASGTLSNSVTLTISASPTISPTSSAATSSPSASSFTWTGSGSASDTAASTWTATKSITPLPTMTFVTPAYTPTVTPSSIQSPTPTVTIAVSLTHTFSWSTTRSLSLTRTPAVTTTYITPAYTPSLTPTTTLSISPVQTLSATTVQSGTASGTPSPTFTLTSMVSSSYSPTTTATPTMSNTGQIMTRTTSLTPQPFPTATSSVSLSPVVTTTITSPPTDSTTVTLTLKPTMTPLPAPFPVPMPAPAPFPLPIPAPYPVPVPAPYPVPVPAPAPAPVPAPVATPTPTATMGNAVECRVNRDLASFDAASWRSLCQSYLRGNYPSTLPDTFVRIRSVAAGSVVVIFQVPIADVGSARVANALHRIFVSAALGGTLPTSLAVLSAELTIWTPGPPPPPSPPTDTPIPTELPGKSLTLQFKFASLPVMSTEASLNALRAQVAELVSNSTNSTISPRDVDILGVDPLTNKVYFRINFGTPFGAALVATSLANGICNSSLNTTNHGNTSLTFLSCLQIPFGSIPPNALFPTRTPTATRQPTGTPAVVEESSDLLNPAWLLWVIIAAAICCCCYLCLLIVLCCMHCYKKRKENNLESVCVDAPETTGDEGQPPLKAKDHPDIYRAWEIPLPPSPTPQKAPSEMEREQELEAARLAAEVALAEAVPVSPTAAADETQTLTLKDGSSEGDEEEEDDDEGEDAKNAWRYKDLDDWTSSDIANWLKFEGLEELIEPLEAHGVSGKVLGGLTNEDLREMGVEGVGNRKAFLTAVGRLTGRELDYRNPYDWTAPMVQRWLQLKHLDDLADKAVPNKITGQALSALDDRDLRDLGIFQLGSARAFGYHRDELFRRSPPRNPVVSPDGRPFPEWIPEEVIEWLHAAGFPDAGDLLDAQQLSINGAAAAMLTSDDMTIIGIAEGLHKPLLEAIAAMLTGVDLAQARQIQIKMAEEALRELVRLEENDRQRLIDEEEATREAEQAAQAKALRDYHQRLADERASLESEEFEGRAAILSQEEAQEWAALDAEIQASHTSALEATNHRLAVEAEFAALPLLESTTRQEIEDELDAAVAQMHLDVEAGAAAAKDQTLLRQSNERTEVEDGEEAVQRQAMEDEYDQGIDALVQEERELREGWYAFKEAQSKARADCDSEFDTRREAIIRQEDQMFDALHSSEIEQRDWRRKKELSDRQAVADLVEQHMDSCRYGQMIESNERMWGQREEVELRELVERHGELGAEEAAEREVLRQRKAIAWELAKENELFKQRIQAERQAKEAQMRSWIHHRDQDNKHHDAREAARRMRRLDAPDEWSESSSLNLARAAATTTAAVKEEPPVVKRPPTYQQQQEALAAHQLAASIQLTNGFPVEPPPHDSRECCDDRDEMREIIQEEQRRRLEEIGLPSPSSRMLNESSHSPHPHQPIRSRAALSASADGITSPNTASADQADVTNGSLNASAPASGKKTFRRKPRITAATGPQPRKPAAAWNDGKF